MRDSWIIITNVYNCKYLYLLGVVVLVVYVCVYSNRFRYDYIM